ncbi:hypothetical protein CEXT_164591 [Caerostris extrusa]|uniref:Uncharacterized protein n=1 Tax=Caerostris extrusa TaxID=172846 RepID=A0AAV4SHE9_CAEEX|nr:hypothetical protein CEXT_164591 [Caerostris extrusa]
MPEGNSTMGNYMTLNLPLPFKNLYHSAARGELPVFGTETYVGKSSTHLPESMPAKKRASVLQNMPHEKSYYSVGSCNALNQNKPAAEPPPENPGVASEGGAKQ